LGEVHLVADLAQAQPFDLLVFAVPDRALADAARLACGHGSVWLHLSGAVAPDVLQIAGGPTQVAAMHPLCALPDPIAGATAEQAAAPLRGALCAVGGAAQAVARALAERVGGLAFVLDPAGRAAYHAAAALVANDLVALLALGGAACEAAGVPQPLVAPGLLHLARSSLSAVAGRPLAAGLTGAVSRGDAATLASHLQALANHPPAAAVHAALSEVLLALVATRLPAEQVAAVRAALGQAFKT